MKTSTLEIFEELFARYPALEACRADVRAAFDELAAAYRAGGKVLCCGNGGSASDCEHIVGELLKKFKRHRDIPSELKERLSSAGPDGELLAARLEGSQEAESCQQADHSSFHGVSPSCENVTTNSDPFPGSL